MFRRFSTGMRQQVISVGSGLATLLCALIWAAFGALVPEAGGAHITTAEAVRADGVDAAMIRDQVEGWMDVAEQDEDGREEQADEGDGSLHVVSLQRERSLPVVREAHGDGPEPR